MNSIDASIAERAQRKICAIFPGALGDFICFLPALQALARAARVDLFARTEFADLAPDGVSVSSLERREIGGLFGETAEGANGQEFFGAYDAVYSWFASANDQFVRRLKALSGGRARFFPFRPSGAEPHQIDHYLGCLEVRGAREPTVALRAAAVCWREKFWLDHGLGERPVLTVAPGSGAREKNWPAEFFLEVVHWWAAATGGAVVLLIGPVEQERGGIDALRENCLVASGLSLAQAAALLSRSDVCLGNDSGMAHLAAALGVRTVALFGPSDPRRWAPRGNNVTLLRRALECSPCLEPVMKSCPHRACLTELQPREVISTLAHLPEVVTLTR